MESIGFPPVTVALFLLSVAMLVAVDVSSHKRGEAVSLSSAIKWTVIYIAAAGLFAVHLYSSHGSEPASLFITGYTLEKVLAFDNLFVFSLIFSYFKLPEADRHAALHWGIMGAVVFRLIFVALGVGSLALFGPFMELVFAAIIAYTIYLIITSDEEDADYNNAWYVVRLRRVFPNVSIFIITICVIEVSDVMFAFDSVPAIIAVTRDPLLVYTSMIYAILGLRSMYFVIEALKKYLTYLDQTIIVVLAFISAKLAAHALFGYKLEPTHSLVIVLSILVVGTTLSLLKPEKENA